MKKENDANPNEWEEMMPPRLGGVAILEKLAAKQWDQEVIDMTFAL